MKICPICGRGSSSWKLFCWCCDHKFTEDDKTTTRRLTMENLKTNETQGVADACDCVPRLVRCSICERQFPPDELKEADDFDPQGNHRYLMICEECESYFDKLDISFNFSANSAISRKISAHADIE